MKKERTIKVEISSEELAQIIYEWSGKRPTPYVAARILASIRKVAQDRLEQAAFTIITDLTE